MQLLHPYFFTLLLTRLSNKSVRHIRQTVMTNVVKQDIQ